MALKTCSKEFLLNAFQKCKTHKIPICIFCPESVQKTPALPFCYMYIVNYSFSTGVPLTLQRLARV